MTVYVTSTRTLRSIAELDAAGLIAPGERDALEQVASRYAVAVTPEMTRLIEREASDDPIGKQFLPDARELETRADECSDPIGDEKFEQVAGLVHRYPDRVLLKVTHACPVYCRFCFRREMVGPGGAHTLDDAALDRAIGYIAGNPAISEVILTGGDPLVLSARRIAELTRRLSAIPSVSVLRWHSRVPVVAPETIDEAMIAALTGGGKAVYLSIHTNHPRELSAAAREAIGRLADGGIVLLSQTVLLRGVNNDAATLEALFRALVGLRVRPYYLHHLDRAPGTAHFRTTIAEGQAIMRQMRGRLSGLAQPAYVLDIPGGVAKVPIGPNYLDEESVRDPWGGRHDLDRG